MVMYKIFTEKEFKIIKEYYKRVGSINVYGNADFKHEKVFINEINQSILRIYLNE